jgi:hypothetical protein
MVMRLPLSVMGVTGMAVFALVALAQRLLPPTASFDVPLALRSSSSESSSLSRSPRSPVSHPRCSERREEK